MASLNRMKVELFIALLAVVSVALPTCDAVAFMKGASTAGVDAAALKQLKDAGVTHVRRYALWKYIEPKLDSLNASLSVAALRADPEGLIYAWAATRSWTNLDQQIINTHAAGIEPLVEVGEGTIYGLPKYGTSYADPGVIGSTDLYLAYQYRAARAVAHRYKKYVRLFQIENELNEAYLEGFAGQRLITAPWGNWTFVTEVLRTLRMAIKDEDPTALVTTNLHTDVPAVLHSALHLDGYYENATRDWAHLVDVFSFDAYPNMYVATPILEAELVKRMKNIKAAAGGSMQVFVAETGYPVNAPTNTNIPSPLVNFSDANCADYISQSVSALEAAGCSGYFYFKIVPETGMEPPPGGYTTADVSMFAAVRNLLVNDDVDGFLKWLLEPGDLYEALTRAGHFLSAPTAGWGLLYADGKPRPGFDALRKAFQKR